eukprot:s6090_g2.t1
MGVSPPDSSVLLRGIELIIGSALKKLPDTSFRLALARNELQLQNRPTQESVLRYFDHALAELQQSAPTRSSTRTAGGMDEPPKLRAADAQAGTGGTAARTPPGSPTKDGQRQGACKFFQTDQGCRRGAGCKYTHEFSSKDEKRSRCWFCGSKQHRQPECPVKDPARAKRNGGGTTAPSPSTAAQAPTSMVAVATAPEPKAMMVPCATSASSTMSTTCSEGPVVQAEAVQAFTPEVMQNPELQNFVKEVNTMLQRMSALRAMRVREPVAPGVAKMEKALEAFELPREPWALLDSGATHPFKNVEPTAEDKTLPVQVTLADGNNVTLQQNRAGTLMPARGSAVASGTASTTIVPLGTLVQELGCTVSWDRQGLRVQHPEHGVIITHVAGSCPFIGEARALQLIEEIEARKLEQLKVKTLETQLKMRGIEATVSFEAQLHEYRRTGRRTDGLQALMCEDSVFGVLTEAQRCSLIQEVDLSEKAGHKYLKALPVKRAMRRRLMSSRWMVHLFSGETEGDGSGFKALEEDGVTLLEIDIGLSRSFNMREPGPVYQALLWAAMRGQVHGVLGGPPRTEGAGDLVIKQMFIWTLARLAAESYEIACPGFVMCMPSKSELWTSALWSSFRTAYGVKLCKGPTDVSLATTLEVEPPDGPWERQASSGTLTWTGAFKEALIRGFQRWRTIVHLRRMNGPLSEMSKEELSKWLQHVRAGHVPFHRRCKTCVASKATGHAHRRIEAPSCFTMSLDVCGPFRVRGHTPEAKDLKYMLVASYTMPRLSEGRLGPQDEIINEPEGGVGEIPLDGPVPEVPREVPDGPVPEVPGEVPDGPVPEVPGEVPDGPVPEVPGEVSDGPVVDLDGVFDEEESQGEEAPSQVEQEEMSRQNHEFNELVAEVGDTMNYQVLRFAVPMQSRRAAEVNQRVRQLYLQIRSEGLEVLRCHSDRARELCNSRLRAWLNERGVLCTTGEAQSPQQNGRAEASVRFVKTEAKVLLTASGLSKENWPLAMRYAVYRQRLQALGKDEALPQFGCPVHVRTKIYGKAERYDLDNKWMEGVYVGPSEDVAHGHVVKFSDNTFVTSQHLKTNLVDADALVDSGHREIELPLPERRARRKTRLAAFRTDHPLSPEEERAESFARDLCRSGSGTPEEILQLFDLLKKVKVKQKRGRAAGESGCSWTTGMFVHGGVAGLRENTVRMKWCTKFLVKAARGFCQDHEFAAVGLLENVNMGCHKDSRNEVDLENVLVMLKRPDTGGQLWLEDESLDPREAEWKQVTKKLSKKGAIHELEVGSPLHFNPRKWHEVQPWEGDRVVMVLYNPRASHLHYSDRDHMEFVGFPISPTRVTSARGVPGEVRDVLARGGAELHLLQALPHDGLGTLDDALLTLTEDQQQLLEDLEERSARLRLLLEEEDALLEECRRAGRLVGDEVENVRGILEDMMEEIATIRKTSHGTQQQHCLRAAAVAQDQIDYERMLEEMKGDLEVVHTVPLDQVRPALHKWMGAIEKEIKQLLDGTLRPMPTSRAKELERQGRLKLVPSKAVCTLKPPATKGERARRRFRLVLCGNFAAPDDPSCCLYAGGVSAETVRLALAIAAGRKWLGATSDITAAFLLAEWPEELARYAIFPPRMLIEAGFVAADQVWEVLKPLYGLRESPSIWSKCRSARLASAKLLWGNKTVVLKPSEADPDLWLAYDQDDPSTLLGLVVTYVDDLLYLAEESLVVAIHMWIEREWPCSPLEWAKNPGGTRYLGMEIHQRVDGNFEISQEGYVKELLRNHGMVETVASKLPCPKEWLVEGGGNDTDENFSVEELKFAQRVVGEQLWLAMRTRPDLQFPVGFMAAKVSKQPNRVAQIARKILAYLNTTKSLKLVLGPEHGGNNSLVDEQQRKVSVVGYSDASFSPYGEKSYGASVVTVMNSPVAWKASKQGFVTLSVMEAELYEALNATVLMESVGSILDEVLGYRAGRILRVDNASAVSMLGGGPGSWRTRHLKVRSAKIRDQVESGDLQVEHVTGDLQIADLATKMHPKMRLWELLTLWGFKDLPVEAVEALEAKSAYLAMLVLALMVCPAGADDNPSEKSKLQSIGIDELMLVTVLVCITAVALWEMAKWVFRCLVRFFKETPKQRRLRKLKETAKLAAEEEVERAFKTRATEAPRASSSAASTRAASSVLDSPPEPHPVTRPRTMKRIVDPTMEPVPQPREMEFELLPEKSYYKTNSTRSKLHTDPHCHGLRNSGDVYAVEYCTYCQRNLPLYTRRSRSLQPTGSY